MTSPGSGAGTGADLPDYAPIPRSALGPALNDQGYYVGRVERNLYWVTDGLYQSAFLTTGDGVVLFDAPPSIGGNLRRAADQITATEGVSNTVTHLVYSHHHADHAGASFLFDGDVTHSPDNIHIHFPGHDTLMFIDVVNAGWVPIYNVNLSDDVIGYMGGPAIALSYPWTHFIYGHLGRLATHNDVAVHQAYIADIEASAREALAAVDPLPYYMAAEENAWAGGQRRLGRRHPARGRARHRQVHRRAGRRGHRGFTTTTTFAIMQSLRLDRGPSGPVHP